MPQKQKCPVCDWDIEDGGKTVRSAGTAVVVCCDECAEKVRQHPGTYAPQR
jgi:hypothetical protein